LWHDDSARLAVLERVESLALALASCSTSAQTSVRHAAAFVRCTALLRCDDVNFQDDDGLNSRVNQRHLTHVFPELLRLRSSSRPQSSSRLRPLSASSPAVVSSADMIVFSSVERERKVIYMRGLLHVALADVFNVPKAMLECSELACAVLDVATLLCVSSDRARAKLLELSAVCDSSLLQVLLHAIQSPSPCVSVAALQLAAALRHNSECLVAMSCSSTFVSALRRSIQRMSHSNPSDCSVKAAACACSLLHSIVASAPSVASCLLYGRRFGRSEVPVECAAFDAVCLQRVHREEDEASDDSDSDSDAAAASAPAQIFFVENELYDASNTTKESCSPLPSPLSTQSKRATHLASSADPTGSPMQFKKTLCAGSNGLKRQQRLMAGLQQCILSDNLTCRCAAVMLAAELAEVFVNDGLPALSAASAPSLAWSGASVAAASVSPAAASLSPAAASSTVSLSARFPFPPSPFRLELFSRNISMPPQSEFIRS
jgi:hypothetical protein